MTENFVPCHNPLIVSQIGRGNVLAISGGRVQGRDTGITLPVAHGYKVTVDYTAADTYTVRRTYTRGAKVWVKAEWTDVHAAEVGGVAYKASCYLDA